MPNVNPLYYNGVPVVAKSDSKVHFQGVNITEKRNCRIIKKKGPSKFLGEEKRQNFKFQFYFSVSSLLCYMQLGQVVTCSACTQGYPCSNPGERRDEFFRSVL